MKAWFHVELNGAVQERGIVSPIVTEDYLSSCIVWGRRGAVGFQRNGTAAGSGAVTPLLRVKGRVEETLWAPQVLTVELRLHEYCRMPHSIISKHQGR